MRQLIVVDGALSSEEFEAQRLAFARAHPLPGSNDPAAAYADATYPEDAWKTDHNAFNHLVFSSFDDWGHEQWLTITSGLSLLADLANHHGIELGLFFLPVRHQVEAAFVANEPQVQYAKIATALGIAQIDTLPDLRQEFRRSPEVQLYYDHCHVTPRGNEIVGRVAARLVASILADERGQP